MEGLRIEYLDLIRDIRSFVEHNTLSKKKLQKKELSNSAIPSQQPSSQVLVSTPSHTPTQAIPLPIANPASLTSIPSQAITITKKEEKKVGLFTLTQFGMPSPLDISHVQKELPSFKKASFFCPILICFLHEKQREFSIKLAHALTLQKRYATSHYVDVSELTNQIKKEWPFVLTFSHSSLLPHLPENFRYHSFYPRKKGRLFLLHPIEEYEQNSNSKRNLWTILLAQLPPSLST